MRFGILIQIVSVSILLALLWLLAPIALQLLGFVCSAIWGLLTRLFGFSILILFDRCLAIFLGWFVLLVLLSVITGSESPTTKAYLTFTVKLMKLLFSVFAALVQSLLALLRRGRTHGK